MSVTQTTNKLLKRLDSYVARLSEDEKKILENFEEIDKDNLEGKEKTYEKGSAILDEYKKVYRSIFPDKNEKFIHDISIKAMRGDHYIQEVTNPTDEQAETLLREEYNIITQNEPAKQEDFYFKSIYNREATNDEFERRVFTIAYFIVKRIYDYNKLSMYLSIDIPEHEIRPYDLSIFEVFSFFKEYKLYKNQQNRYKNPKKTITIHFTDNNDTDYPKTEKDHEVNNITEFKKNIENLIKDQTFVPTKEYTQQQTQRIKYFRSSFVQLLRYPPIVLNSTWNPSRLFRAKVSGPRWRLNKNMFRRTLGEKYGGTRKKRRTRRRKRSKRA
jgi:hypothetical protein